MIARPGATGSCSQFIVTCADYEGAGVKSQQWTAPSGRQITDWAAPDKELGARDTEESAAGNAEGKGHHAALTAARSPDRPLPRPARRRLAGLLPGCGGRSGPSAGSAAAAATAAGGAKRGLTSLTDPCYVLRHAVRRPPWPRCTSRSTTSRSSYDHVILVLKGVSPSVLRADRRAARRERGGQDDDAGRRFQPAARRAARPKGNDRVQGQAARPG